MTCDPVVSTLVKGVERKLATQKSELEQVQLIPRSGLLKARSVLGPELQVQGTFHPSTPPLCTLGAVIESEARSTWTPGPSPQPRAVLRLSQGLGLVIFSNSCRLRGTELGLWTRCLSHRAQSTGPRWP